MNEQMRELGERAVKCKRWRWSKSAGSAILHPGNSCDIVTGGYDSERARDGRSLIATAHHRVKLIEPVGVIPDFDDAAARGCLLAMVREAYNHPGIYAYIMGSEGWCVHAGNRPYYGPTEAHALVAALEAAP